MKALLLSNYRQLEITEVPTPSPGPDEVLVQVAACGICGSDVHGYDGSSGRPFVRPFDGEEPADVPERLSQTNATLSQECSLCRTG